MTNTDCNQILDTLIREGVNFFLTKNCPSELQSLLNDVEFLFVVLSARDFDLLYVFEDLVGTDHPDVLIYVPEFVRSLVIGLASLSSRAPLLVREIIVRIYSLNKLFSRIFSLLIADKSSHDVLSWVLCQVLCEKGCEDFVRLLLLENSAPALKSLQYEMMQFIVSMRGIQQHYPNDKVDFRDISIFPTLEECQSVCERLPENKIERNMNRFHYMRFLFLTLRSNCLAVIRNQHILPLLDIPANEEVNPIPSQTVELFDCSCEKMDSGFSALQLQISAIIVSEVSSSFFSEFLNSRTICGFVEPRSHEVPEMSSLAHAVALAELCGVSVGRCSSYSKFVHGTKTAGPSEKLSKGCVVHLDVEFPDAASAAVVARRCRERSGLRVRISPRASLFGHDSSLRQLASILCVFRSDWRECTDFGGSPVSVSCSSEILRFQAVDRLDRSDEPNIPYTFSIPPPLSLNAMQPLTEPVHPANGTVASVLKDTEGDFVTMEGMRLKKSQEIAGHMALSRRLTLVQGVPGSGKTHLGVELALRALRRGDRVCILTLKNHTVDSILRTLLARGVDASALMRLGEPTVDTPVSVPSLDKLLRSLPGPRRLQLSSPPTRAVLHLPPQLQSLIQSSHSNLAKYPKSASRDNSLTSSAGAVFIENSGEFEKGGGKTKAGTRELALKGELLGALQRALQGAQTLLIAASDPARALLLLHWPAFVTTRNTASTFRKGTHLLEWAYGTDMDTAFTAADAFLEGAECPNAAWEHYDVIGDGRQAPTFYGVSLHSHFERLLMSTEASQGCPLLLWDPQALPSFRVKLAQLCVSAVVDSLQQLWQRVDLLAATVAALNDAPVHTLINRKVGIVVGTAAAVARHSTNICSPCFQCFNSSKGSNSKQSGQGYRGFGSWIVEEAAEISESVLIAALGTPLESQSFSLVMIGDHMQLTPMVERLILRAPPRLGLYGRSEGSFEGESSSGENDEGNCLDRRLWADISLFERLFESSLESKVTLKQQFRMTDDLSQFMKVLAYPSLLDGRKSNKSELMTSPLVKPIVWFDSHSIAFEELATASQKMQSGASSLSSPGHRNFSLPSLNDFSFSNTNINLQNLGQNGRRISFGSYWNMGEAKVVVEICLRLLRSVKANQITVLTPYSSQVSLLQSILTSGYIADQRNISDQWRTVIDAVESVVCGTLIAEPAYLEKACGKLKAHTPAPTSLKTHLKDLSSIRVASIDSFQGDESDFVILSLVRNNVNQDIGFLRELGRLVVLFSRQRVGLLVVGSLHTFSADKNWKKILSVVRSYGVLCTL